MSRTSSWGYRLYRGAAARDHRGVNGEDLAWFAALAGVSGVAAKLVSAWAGRSRAAQDEVWKTAARRLGAKVGRTPTDDCWLELAVEGMTIEVTTRARARTVAVLGPLPGAGSAALDVRPRGRVEQRLRAFASAGARARRADALRETFHVAGDPPVLATRLLADAPLRAALLVSGEGFELAKGHVLLERDGIPEDDATVVALVRHLESIALAWKRLLEGPLRVADGLELARATELALVGEDDATVAEGTRRLATCAVRVRLRGEDTALCFVVLGLRSEIAEGSMVRDDEAPDGFLLEGALPDPLLELMQGAPSALVGLRAHGRVVELAFDGLDPPPSVVLAIVDAVLARVGGTGPYR